MTTSPDAPLVPAWTLGDRLRKARMTTGLSVKEFAAQIGVSPKSVNNAEADKHAVRPIVLNAWALATRVSREWLETGQGSPTPTSGPDGPRGGRGDAVAKLRQRKQARHAEGSATGRYPAAA